MKRFLLSIFAVMLAVFSVQAEEVTLNASDVVGKGKSGGGGGFEYTVSPISFNFSSAYGISSSELRFYKSSTLEISGATITKVQFTAASSKYGGTVTANSGSITVNGLTQTWEGSTTSLIITATGSQIRTASIVVTYTTTGEGGGEETKTVSPPTFDPADGAIFTGATLPVTISTATEGATIHYTINDGAEQTGASPVSVNVTETTTIVAYATLDGYENSANSTATYTKVTPISIAEAKAAYDAAGADVEVVIDLAGAVVTANYSNGKYVFIQDDEAGIYVYGSSVSYPAGTMFTGGRMTCISTLYSGLHEITNAVFSDVLTTTTTVEPIVVTVAELNANFDTYEGRYVKLEGVNLSGTTITQGEDVYAIYNRFSIALEDAAVCDVLGVVTCNIKNGEKILQIFPTEIIVPEPALAAPTLPASTTFDGSYEVTITAGDGVAIYYTLDGNEPTKESTLYDGSFTITETTTVKAIAVKGELVSATTEATYTKNTPVTPPAEGEVVDVINIQTIGIDSYGSYTSWTGVQSNSSAVYAGQSHKNGDAVQLRATSPSGIISTASAGKLKKIVVEWASNTTSGRTLNVYGKNTAYSTAADLYSTSKQGTLLGTIVCGTSTELVIEGDYEYIGVCSASGAMYLTSISITWDESAGVTPVAPNAPVLPASTTFEGSMLVEITGIASDATVYYTTDESDPATSDTRVEYTEPFEITATTTVKAIAVNEVGTSEMATATYTYLEPIDLSDCTVAEAIEAFKNGHTGEATITGYIVGTMVNNEVVFGDISTAANLLIADDADEEDPAKCIPVQLSSGTKIREVLSLKDTPANMGRKITVVGSLEAYFSRAGLKSLSSAGLYWNVSSAGYATLYLGYKAEIPSTVKAYIVTGVETGFVTLTQVEGILPIETGVILEGEGEHLFNITSDEAADVKNNLLEGTVDATEIDVEAYVLGNVDGVGLYKAKMTDGVWLNNANKAYLPAVAGAANVASYSFRFGEGTTGIDQITDNREQRTENREQSTVIYDLTGRRVENISAPGIYIINGVKTLVK